METDSFENTTWKCLVQHEGQIGLLMFCAPLLLPLFPHPLDLGLHILCGKWCQKSQNTYSGTAKKKRKKSAQVFALSNTSEHETSVGITGIENWFHYRCDKFIWEIKERERERTDSILSNQLEAPRSHLAILKHCKRRDGMHWSFSGQLMFMNY